MNYAMSAKPKVEQKLRPVSDQELARFLRHLSTIYNNKATGNRRLSLAISLLAEEVSKRSEVPSNQHSTEQMRLWEIDVKKLDADAVLRFLDQKDLPKNSLLKIGLERFSIARSKLAKLTIESVRAEIRAALMHEESVKIIEQEAARGGTNRTS